VNKILSTPQSWQVKSLGDLSALIQYGYTAKAQGAKVGPKFLRITDIQDNSVKWQDVPFCFIDDREKAKYLLDEGDLLFARTGATVGKSFLIKGVIPESVFASYLIRVRLQQSVDPKYIAYFFKSPDYWSQISESQSGIGQPNVNGTKLAQIQIPVAPLPQQKSIVAEIEKQFSRLDEAVANLKRVKANLKRYKAAVLKAAVEGKLTEQWRKEHPNVEPASKLLERILAERRAKWKGKERSKEPNPPNFSGFPKSPKGWVWTTVGHLADVQLGKMLDKNKQRTGRFLRYLRNVNVRWGSFATDDLLEMFFKDEELERYGLRAGDVLVCEGGEPGRAAVWDGRIPDMKYQKALHRVRFHSGFEPKLFVFVLEHYAKSGTLETLFTGSTINHLTRESILQLAVPLPPVPEQRMILDEVERRLSMMDELEKEVMSNLQRAERLRQSILGFAFSGKLVQQNADAESGAWPDLPLAAEAQGIYKNKK